MKLYYNGRLRFSVRLVLCFVMFGFIWFDLCSVPILLSCALFYSSSVVLLVLVDCSLLVMCVCSAKRRISATSKSAKASIMGCPRAVNERYHGVFALAIFNGCAIGSRVPYRFNSLCNSCDVYARRLVVLLL